MSRVENDYARSVAQGVQTDVVGAVGLAGKRAPLATALLRLFVGDDRSAHDVVRILAGMAQGKAHRIFEGGTLAEIEAVDLARAVLAWHRDGVCKACHGRRWAALGGETGGRAVLSAEPCAECRGLGRLPLDRQFTGARLALATWLADEIDREQRVAGVEAMKHLAAGLDRHGTFPASG